MMLSRYADELLSADDESHAELPRRAAAAADESAPPRCAPMTPAAAMPERR